jgi:RTX calcium-binding nonapeptide repeat (4 copies)
MRLAITGGTAWTARSMKVAMLLVVAGIITGSPASAASASWQCRASAVHASVLGNSPVEPIVANAGPRCEDAQAGLENLAQSLGLPSDLLQARTTSAITSIDPDAAASDVQRVGALGRVEALTLQLPPGGSGLVLGVGVANAQAAAACVNGRPQLAGASSVASLTVNGNAVPLDQLAQQLSAALAPLGQIVDLRVNEQVRDGTSLTQRALHLRLLTVSGTPVLDVVAGEARVGFDAAVCSGGGADSGTPPSPNPCPPGSELDTARTLCVIHVAANSAHGAMTIVVGRPFEGPSGAGVVALEAARRRFHSPCLRGKGPEYAIIGSAKADRITGTNRADRILSLAGSDRVDGGRGNDCVDGGGGRDTLSGALGRDRVYGTAGNDALNGGGDTDRLSGGQGNDTINTAYGADHAYGGTGNDAINAATAGPRAHVSCGSGRDTARINATERRIMRGCENRYVLPDKRHTRH